MAKSYAVLGLGKFGYHVALGLVENGENVILCDNAESSFTDLRDKAEQIYIIDCTDKIALKEAGVSELDIVIVSIGENIEASILTVMALKELNNKKIIAKAISSTHGAILEKLGVEEVVYAERQAANRLLSEITEANVEEIELSANMRACKTIVTNYFVKRSIGTIREEDNVKIVAVRRGETWNIDVDSDFVLQRGDVVLFLGYTEHIEAIMQTLED
ncbi:potassium channel family protein [Helicobacter trogontum]|uniref:TrkA family potassium uptake protein n=1 Tax=Helicobacter trogontum TaxID=50960 RepID=A0A099VER4_9HELI|nr:TrkA family potassium uptake protein [Helicobacter trogontum]MCI5787129.1 TrkA family potassium uptake protein [Helicobacter trogontum]MDY5184472.1 TrkA family potassium uptake protein [Helicobacter trogontum]TLD84281.1 TrkA family potassium uptake protein [Helicobacter trogontum]TLD99711.1 TrkA family potassium uptake protein [Helicobacter trogontum]